MAQALVLNSCVKTREFDQLVESIPHSVLDVRSYFWPNFVQPQYLHHSFNKFAYSIELPTPICESRAYYIASFGGSLLTWVEIETNVNCRIGASTSMTVRVVHGSDRTWVSIGMWLDNARCQHQFECKNPERCICTELKIRWILVTEFTKECIRIMALSYEIQWCCSCKHHCRAKSSNTSIMNKDVESINIIIQCSKNCTMYYHVFYWGGRGQWSPCPTLPLFPICSYSTVIAFKIILAMPVSILYHALDYINTLTCMQ